MSDVPPTPGSMPPSPSIVPTNDDHALVTTSQLGRTIEEAIGCRIDDSTIDELLLECDRLGYVSFVSVTRSGESLWNLSETPDRIAETIADAAVARLQSWLQVDSDT